MKLWWTVGGLILSNIVFILLYAGALSTHSNQANTIKANEQVVRTRADGQVEAQEHSGADVSSPSRDVHFIEETVRMIFDYNNENYLSRFEVVEDRTTGEILHQLRGMAGNNTPDTQFENQVENIKVYVAPSTSGQPSTTHALVYLTSTYEIEGSDPTKRNQIFHVSVRKQGDDYTLTNLESYGYIHPLSQS